ncbi:MAG: zinc-binding dehydrogenase [Candidatus Thorarchaeota archaeon]
MKATVFHEHGSVDVLKYEDFPDPEIKEGQVLVDVKSVALNHLDLFVRKGIPGLNLEMPHILGSDISGVIREVDVNVSEDLQPGQRVVIDPGTSCGVCEFCNIGEESLCAQYGIIGEHSRGGYAERIAVDSLNIVPVPEDVDLDFPHLAAAPLTFMTAWRMLHPKARIRQGDSVLIIGIGGGVSLAALQIANSAGARTLVTSSSDEKIERAIALGADVGINHKKTPDYHKEVWTLTNKRGVDIVVDSVGEVTWERSLRSLTKGGRLVTCGATSGSKAMTNVSLVFWKQLEILGSTMASRSELRDVLKLVWNGSLTPVVDSVHKLSEAKTAHERLEKGEQFGKIVLQP